MTARNSLFVAAIALALALIGGGDVTFAQEAPMPADLPAQDAPVVRLPSALSLQASADLQDGSVIETLGFHAPGDGGAALYHIRQLPEGLQPNGADVLALPGGLVAVLLEREGVNYRMFGAVGDGQSDDGVQIKLAHEYANRHGIPVINLSGEFWLRETNRIPIRTSVNWGQTLLHIDEEFNTLQDPRFEVLGDESTLSLVEDEELKAALLGQIRPGVHIIPELAPYADHLINVRDNNDRMGIRAGYEGNRGWAREELFYVEEEGRIVGDIAFAFSDLTTITATPCPDTYLVIEGGGFIVSGENPNTGSTGYHWNGFSIRRSRTIIRQQWVGLEEGARDASLAARNGFYSFSGVYDVTLQDIRLMPWEKTRRAPEVAVPHGTYGIGGSRMLNCTFRNLTAEAGWVAWGVFGTNINKNFRIEQCRLNRIDVHFHCWNLYIEDSEIGFKGISVTGGGDLFIEDTVRDGNNFVSFRPDYGSKWDGRIRMRGCTLRPTGAGNVSVLSYGMRNFDYQYQVGFARSIVIDDLLIDYAAAPASAEPCWLMSIVPFAQTPGDRRLFFPTFVRFSDIRVIGREQGVRLVRIPSPYGYDLGSSGGYDGSTVQPNCTIVVDRVQLARLTAERPDDATNVHLLIGGSEAQEYTDESALYPKILFRDCDGLSAYLGNCAAEASFERCSISMLTADELQGALSFTECGFQPRLQEVEGEIYALDSTLGTRFTNCTLHAPVVAGESVPALVDKSGILSINGPVRYFHLNTTLGNSVLQYCREAGIALTPEFIARLRSHHALEE